jgi:hypothetical protein
MISEKELGTLELYLKQAFNEGTKSYVRDAGLQLHYQKSKFGIRGLSSAWRWAEVPPIKTQLSQCL